MTDLIAVLGLGFFLGMRHATDPDHVVAVTTIVSRERSARSAIAIGLLWGLGHTATIVAVGGAIILFGVVIPPRVGLSMEMAVAALLVVLGAMNLTGALRSIGEHVQAAGQGHSHSHGHTHGRPSLRALGRGQIVRPLVVGLVHGLAGSAAISLLVLATIHDATWALVYLVVFGVGTVVGMTLLTLGMAGPIAKTAGFSAAAERGLVRATGLLSLAFGLFLAYRIGIADGLLVGVPHWTPR